jgi:tripartite-type tricarboxylate transporter receptor subunit TctC
MDKAHRMEHFMSPVDRRAIVAGGLVSLAQARLGTAWAADSYPARQVRIVVPFAPGGVADVLGRLLGQKLSERLGRSFVVENRPGAGANIGATVVASAAADGYTLLLTTSPFVVNPSLMTKLPYDPERDFAAVTIVAVSPNLLVVTPSLPVKNVHELIDYIRRTGGVSFASPGTGTTAHLSGEMFRLALNLDMVHVPFGGGGPALQSTVGGHTPVAFSAMPPAMPLIRAGQLRPLAVTASQRSPALPDVPTLAEAGLADQEAETIVPLVVPAATPRPVIDVLYNEIAKIMALPETGTTLETLGFTALVPPPDEAAARIRAEIARWARVIRDAKIERQ